MYYNYAKFLKLMEMGMSTLVISRDKATTIEVGTYIR